MKIVGGEVEDHSGETNMSAYLAVGVWHHWLVRRDVDFVRALLAGGAPRRSTGWSRMQLPFGGIAGRRSGPTADRTVNRRRCWPAPRASTTRCAPGVALAELLDDPQPEWELAGGRLGHALREHRDLFLDKCDLLDGLVLPGPRRRGPRRRAAVELLERRWDDVRGARPRHPAASTPTRG